MRDSANVRKFDLSVIAKPEIEHAIRCPLERHLLGVSPLIEQLNRVIFSIGVHDRELAIGRSRRLHDQYRRPKQPSSHLECQAALRLDGLSSEAN
jgi:hypothetical protein